MDFPTSIFFLPDSRIFDVLKVRRPYPITIGQEVPSISEACMPPSETSKSYCLHRFSTATLSCAILSNLAVVIVGGFSLFLPPSTLHPQPYPSAGGRGAAGKERGACSVPFELESITGDWVCENCRPVATAVQS